MFGRKNSDAEVRRELAKVFPRLWRYCVTLTANKADADDLAQATCLRALERSDQFQTGTHIDRWIFRIAHRIWLNELRSAKVRRAEAIAPLQNTEFIDEQPNLETNIIAREVLYEVMKLPEAQRTVVLLVYVEGYSYKEAAEVIEIPIGTVMSRLAAARKTLKQETNGQKG